MSSLHGILFTFNSRRVVCDRPCGEKRTCNQTTSTDVKEICDRSSSLKNLKEYYEGELYECKDK